MYSAPTPEEVIGWCCGCPATVALLRAQVGRRETAPLAGPTGGGFVFMASSTAARQKGRAAERRWQRYDTRWWQSQSSAILTEGFQMEEVEANSQKALSATQIGKIFFWDRATHGTMVPLPGFPVGV